MCCSHSACNCESKLRVITRSCLTVYYLPQQTALTKCDCSEVHEENTKQHSSSSYKVFDKLPLLGEVITAIIKFLIYHLYNSFPVVVWDVVRSCLQG